MAEKKKRLNVQVSDELHTELKIASARKGKTITDYVTDAIKEKIDKDNEG